MSFATRSSDALRRLWSGRETFRFLVVGAWNTAFGYGIFAALFLLFHRRVHYLVILVAAHFLSVANAFLGHKYLTFRAEGSAGKDFLRFNLSYLGTLILGMAGLPFLVEVCGLHPLASQALLSLCTMGASYFLHKHVSFRRKRA